MSVDLTILSEVLQSPLAETIKNCAPFISIGSGGLNIFSKIREKLQSSSDADKVIAGTQAAYIESFREVVSLLERKDLEALQRDKGNISDAFKKKCKIDFPEKEIQTTLYCFHRSNLAKQYNAILWERLKEIGFHSFRLKRFVERVAINTDKHLFLGLHQHIDILLPFANKFDLNLREAYEKYKGINQYLQREDDSLSQDRVFDEDFTIKDIYVPLKAQDVEIYSRKYEDTEPFILENKVINLLLDNNEKENIIFIQGGPGRGKSVFCKTFAHRVRQELYPLFTPIVIRLREIDIFDRHFKDIISNHLFDEKFVDGNGDWLKDENTPYLMILDGFDELRMQGRIDGGIEEFIRKAAQFQDRFSQYNHRIILTGRDLALKGITLPPNLERIKLEIMDDEILDKWYSKWERVVYPNDIPKANQEIQEFRAFLKGNKFLIDYEEGLAREPLLLYLLAAMHRDDEQDDENNNNKINQLQKIRNINHPYEEEKGVLIKNIIYENSLDWVLNKQRDKLLQANITGLKEDNVESTINTILTEAALCVIQSEGEYAKVNLLQTRLEENNKEIGEIFNQLVERYKIDKEEALTTTLCTFYIQSFAKEGGGFEFCHKSFSEFLFAKRIQNSIEKWTTRIDKDKFLVEEQEFLKEVYDLLGYGGLTEEIVGYLRGLWVANSKSNSEFKPLELFHRLEDFYFRWCKGEFIDRVSLPRWKMRQFQDENQYPEKGYLGLRQVDIYAGLNVMILLLELHRYAQLRDDLKEELVFYPCGKPNDQGRLEDETLLLQVIGYSHCLRNHGYSAFVDIVGKFLSGANLEGVNLDRAFLYRPNLSGANLENASLYNTYLEGANLSGAKLYNANLKDADLNLANLSGADLFSVNLSGVNLNNANLEDLKG